MLTTLTVIQTDGSCLVSREQFQAIIKQLSDWKVCIGFLCASPESSFSTFSYATEVVFSVSLSICLTVRRFSFSR